MEKKVKHTSTTISSPEATIQTLKEENFDLRQHIQLLEQEMMDKDRTIKLLQQQMV